MKLSLEHWESQTPQLFPLPPNPKAEVGTHSSVQSLLGSCVGDSAGPAPGAVPIWAFVGGIGSNGAGAYGRAWPKWYHLLPCRW
jgi:hypothetical protein